MDGSDFPFGHAAPFCCAFLRGPAVDQPAESPAAVREVPFTGWVFALDVTVEVEPLDDVDDTDDDEFVRWRVLRAMNMFISLASFDLIEFSDWPPLIHPCRLRSAKLGGLATAVMRKAWLAAMDDESEGESRRRGWGRSSGWGMETGGAASCAGELSPSCLACAVAISP